jgi:ElaB/YqjD/DUF883 family membrane-anchored ribosome-binding protein
MTKPIEQEIINLQGEVQVLLDTLEDIMRMNSRGKTKEMADLIRETLEYYGR